MKIITNKQRALSLVKEHRPVVHQAIDHILDIPCEIDFGVFKPRFKPTVYYWIRMDARFYYLGLAYYHYADYTKCIPAKILKLGEHRHDFEGVVVRIPHYLPHTTPRPFKDVITVYHNEYLYAYGTQFSNMGPSIFIQARGHGIVPLNTKYISKLRKVNTCNRIIIAKNWKHVSLDNFSSERWDMTKSIFNEHGVNMPDQWFDGYFWNAPDKLFEQFEGGGK